MRWFIGLVGLVAIAGAAQAQNDAEKLYRAMEQKFLKAKAYKVAYDISALILGKLERKVTFLATAGNRFKVQIEGKHVEMALKMSFVSNGKKTVTKVERGGQAEEPEERATHDKVYERLTPWQISTGLMSASLRTIERLDPDDIAQAKPTDFKAVGKDKIGGREAQVIEYHLTLGDVACTCKLWLDTETSMPLKRHLIIEGAYNTETYSNWELDPKLPEDTFRLPK